MPISVAAPTDRRGIAPQLRSLVALVLARLGRRTGDVAIVLADDAITRALNRDWRRMDHATDVITFAYDEHEPDAATRPVTGDLVVSMDRVRVQAKRWRVSEPEELARLVIHGALHLCGHDHMRAAERRVMRAYEDAAMEEAAGTIAAMAERWERRSRPGARTARPVRPSARRPAVARSREKRPGKRR